MKHQISHFDYFIVLAAPVFATGFTVYFSLPLIASTFLFAVLPAAYLTARQHQFVAKAGLMALFSIPFTIIVDFFSIADRVWWVSTVFPFRLWGAVPIETLIWSAAWFYYIVAFYEYFIDRSRGHEPSVNKRARLLGLGWGAAMVVFFICYALGRLEFSVPYFYLIFGAVLGLAPLVLVLCSQPKLLPKFVLTGIYFWVVALLHELSALAAGQWTFPGNHYISWVQLGQFGFPLEELLFWVLLASAYVLAWYEYFIDDNR